MCKEGEVDKTIIKCHESFKPATATIEWFLNVYGAKTETKLWVA
jgi:hypothetical protein